MWFLIIILLVAASPIIFILVFSEIMAAKEESKINDNPRKIAKALSWLFFIFLSFFLMYIVISGDSGIHLRQVFSLISYFFRLL